MSRCAIAVLIVAWAFSSVAMGDDHQHLANELDLRGELSHLAYETTIVPRLIPANQDPTSDSQSFLFLDFNGDGHDDLMRSDWQGLVVEDLADSNRVLQSIVLDANFAQPGRPAFALSQCPDLTQDGKREIVAIGHTSDRMIWQMWVIDASDLSIISVTNLPAGRDVRQDGRWDGVYRHATCMEPTADNPRALLVVTCDVGHDVEGRSVLAIDPVDGQLVWRHVVAGVVRSGSMVAGDLDGDGHNEIVMAVSGSDLPRDRMVNGYLDNESQIVMLNEDGTQRWSRKITSGYGGCATAVADVDGDGQLEVVAVHWTVPVPTGGLYIWDLNGELIAEHRCDQPLTGLRILKAPDQPRPDLLVTTAFGNLVAFQLQNQQLTSRLLLHFPYSCAINGVLDLLPEDGPEVVVTDKSGRSVILDANLQPLAQFNASPLAWRGHVTSINVGDGSYEIVRIGAREGSVAFSKRPVIPIRPNPTLALLVSGTFIIVFWMVLRQRRRKLGPDIQHDVRLHLLESLELSGHGDIAPLNAVRRLNFCLRALLADIGDNSRVEIRLGEILTECHEASLPHLTGITDRARLAGLKAQTVEAADYAVVAVRRIVQKLALVENVSRPDENLIDELGKAEKTAESSLRDLRQEVAQYFRADPRVAIERVLRANRDRMQKTGVSLYQEEKAMAAAGGSETVETVVNGAMELPSGTCCLIDPMDLDQVLDNVIANATQSMKNTAIRRLRIEQKLTDGMVVIDVTDTGCGIASVDQERALSTHYSTKSSGGTGLPASRKILRRYGGQISILHSEPGRGTTIRITTMAI